MNDLPTTRPTRAWAPRQAPRRGPLLAMALAALMTAALSPACTSDERAAGADAAPGGGAAASTLGQPTPTDAPAATSTTATTPTSVEPVDGSVPPADLEPHPTTSGDASPTTPSTAAPAVTTTVGWATDASGPPPTDAAGDACPSPAELATAVTADLGDEVALGSGVVDVRCADRWATGWTNPDPADPLLWDPAVVLFQRTDERWVAVSGGMETDCLDRVPDELWSALDCL